MVIVSKPYIPSIPESPERLQANIEQLVAFDERLLTLPAEGYVDTGLMVERFEVLANRDQPKQIDLSPWSGRINLIKDAGAVVVSVTSDIDYGGSVARYTFDESDRGLSCRVRVKSYRDVDGKQRKAYTRRDTENGLGLWYPSRALRLGVLALEY